MEYPTTYTRPAAQPETIEYDGNLNPVSVTDPERKRDNAKASIAEIDQVNLGNGASKWT